MSADHLFCPYCGSINREEAKFCLRCGRRMRTVCNVCGHSNGIDVSFCLRCGTRLANQKPIDQVIGYFVNKRDWQNILVTTGDMGPFPLIRYVWTEMVRMGLCPLFIQWEQSKSPIEELLVDIVTSLDAIDKHPDLHRIIEKIKSGLLSGARDEALSLINERLKSLKQPIALLIYLPPCPISYSAWKFTRDYFFLIRRLTLPVFTITTSPLTPVYAGFFAEKKDLFSVLIRRSFFTLPASFALLLAPSNWGRFIVYRMSKPNQTTNHLLVEYGVKVPASRLFCPYCGSINREEAKFCRRCGCRLRTLCNVCGHSNGIDVSFCLQCGTRLANQKPIDQVIGYFVKNRNWQNTLVTTGDIEPFPLIRYVWAEMVRMGLRPLFIQWEQSESPIEELLVHIITSLDAIDKHPDLHRIIEKIKSGLLSIARDEALSLINERLKSLKQPIALLIYLPPCPISYSAWRFTQDYFFLTRSLALPVFTITTSPSMPIYAGFFIENKVSFSMKRWLQERLTTRRTVESARWLLAINSGVQFVKAGHTVEISERKIVCYPAFEPEGYILASLIPDLSIQIRAQGTWNVNTDAREMGWEQVTPAWSDLPEELFHELLGYMLLLEVGRKFQFVTFYLYQTESEEENIRSHVAFIPPDTIARLQAPGVLEKDFVLIYS